MASGGAENLPFYNHFAQEALVEKKAEGAVKINSSVTADLNEMPSMVKEGEHVFLSGDALSKRVIAPNVSGCAAIKFSIFSESDKSEPRAAIVFHSDGTYRSKEAARVIANDIRHFDCEEKSVSALVITNGFSSTPMTDHFDVMGIFENKLGADVKVDIEYKRLVRDTRLSMDIDMSGTTHDIRDRYRNHFPREYTKAEKTERQKETNRYLELAAKAKSRGMTTKRIAGGGIKGRTLMDNPHYVGLKVISDWERAEPEQRTALLSELENKITAYDDNKCVIL